MTLNRKTLSDLVAQRRLVPGRPLTVSQLRVAMVPQVVSPLREGQSKRDWVIPRPLKRPDSAQTSR